MHLSVRAASCVYAGGSCFCAKTAHDEIKAKRQYLQESVKGMR
jgi:hypothetical protein